MGIFAKDDIPRGTRIIAGRPLLKAAVDSDGNANISASFNNLSFQQKQAYLELYGFASEESKKRHNWDTLSDLDRKVLATKLAIVQVQCSSRPALH